MHRFWSSLLYFLSGFAPRNSRRLVFGAWLGRKFSDNPKYLLLHLAEQDAGLDLVWIAEESVRPMIPVHPQVRFVPRGSFASCWARLTAGACFVTHAHSDLGDYNLGRGSRRTYLGHGLAIKHMGSKDTVLHNPLLAALRRTLRHSYSYDHYIASSPAHREKLLAENATNNIAVGQILECGQPRIDFLLENSSPARVGEFRARFRAAHGLPPAGKIITYLPTFRDKGMPVFSFSAPGTEQRERLNDLLGRLDAVVVEKSHFAEKLPGADANPGISKRVFNLGGSAGIDTQELMLVTDLLITDYSGCYVDFLVLRRPILHFAYDRAYYENSDRGLYFKLDDVAGGPVAQDFDELCRQIETNLNETSRVVAAQARVRTKLTEFEQGTACRQLAAIVLAQNSIELPGRNAQ